MQEIKNVLGIDLEGMNEDLVYKGVNLLKDRITEIGAVLWDVRMNQPVKILSELINEPDHLPITEEICELTGISDEMLDLYGIKNQELEQFLITLSNLMKKADYIVAHNGNNYDRPMLGSLYNRMGLEFPNTPWIDTASDVEFPNKIKGRSLSQLEYAHGFINPFSHRAVTDVLSMLKIASSYDFSRMALLSQSPKVTLVAKFDPPNWKNKEEVEAFNVIKNKVSKARFKWMADQKKWVKTVPKILLDEGKIEFDFETEQTSES